MVTLAVTLISGAILSATAFTASNYLAKYISGEDPDKERKRHDLALEKYESDYNKYQEKKQKFEKWEYEQDKIKRMLKNHFKIQTKL